VKVIVNEHETDDPTDEKKLAECEFLIPNLVKSEKQTLEITLKNEMYFEFNIIAVLGIRKLVS
jgi:hypothetical protein